MTCGLREAAKSLARGLQRPASRLCNQLPGLLLIGFAVFISVIFINKASGGKLTDLENILFQVITMGIGLIGSFLLGGATARETAMEIVRPHAKSAFRRVLSLYASLARLHKTMDNAKKSLDTYSEAVAAIERFQDIVTEQINTSGDTIEDWGDLVPDEVAKIKETTAALQASQFKK